MRHTLVCFICDSVKCEWVIHCEVEQKHRWSGTWVQVKGKIGESQLSAYILFSLLPRQCHGVSPSHHHAFREGLHSSKLYTDMNPSLIRLLSVGCLITVSRKTKKATIVAGMIGLYYRHSVSH